MMQNTSTTLRKRLTRALKLQNTLTELQQRIAENKTSLRQRINAGKARYPLVDYCLLKYGVNEQAVMRADILFDFYATFSGKMVLFVQTTYNKRAFPIDPEGYDSREVVLGKDIRLVRYTKLSLGVSAGTVTPLLGKEEAHDTLLFATKGAAFNWNEFPNRRMNVSQEQGIELEPGTDIASRWSSDGFGITTLEGRKCFQGEVIKLYDVLFGRYEIKRWAERYKAEYADAVELLMAQVDTV